MRALRHVAIVCFEDPRRVMGGVQRRVAAEIEYFSGRGLTVSVITSGGKDERLSSRVRFYTARTRGAVYPVQSLAFAWGAGRILRNMADVDVVEAHHDGGAAPLIAYRGQRHDAPPVVEVVHGVFFDELAAVRRYAGTVSRDTLAASGLVALGLIERTAARRASAVVTVSEYGAQRVEALYNVPRSRIHVVPNGVDVGTYRPSPEESTRGGKGGECRIVYVGRMHARKGVEYLLRAFALARADRPELRLQLAGGGPLASSLQALATGLGLGESVQFLGSLTDPEIVRLYQRADIVCLPSLQEGQGIVALEAQACGVPVVASRAGGLSEAVDEGRTGVLVAPGDARAVAEALTVLASDPSRRRELGRNARAWAERFSWDRVLADCEALYRSLGAPDPALGGNPVPGHPALERRG